METNNNIHAVHEWESGGFHSRLWKYLQFSNTSHSSFHTQNRQQGVWVRKRGNKARANIWRYHFSEIIKSNFLAFKSYWLCGLTVILSVRLDEQIIGLECVRLIQLSQQISWLDWFVGQHLPFSDVWLHSSRVS